MTDHPRLPPGVDPTVPNVARMYDYYLGGKDNYPADRDAAQRFVEALPEVPWGARENRKFLTRAVRALAGAGVRQFVDLGTGLPTQGQVHQVAHEIDPGARVVYVDYDPVVIAHANALLANRDNVATVRADLRDPDAVLDHPTTRGMIDLDQPVAVLLIAVLHFVPDDGNPAGIIGRLRERLSPGSYLAVSHAAWGERRRQQTEEAAALYQRATAAVTFRSPEQILALFGDAELLEPGLVPTHEWRPDAEVVVPGGGVLAYGAVARV